MEKQYEIRTVRLDLIDPNSWNPNQEDAKAFDTLTEELDHENGGVGYIDLMQVVPLESGRYRLIGGEHRWKALKVLGEEEADCVVLTADRWKDEDLQKFVTMRLNMIKGNLNPDKFMQLYLDLAKRHSEDDMQRLMAVTDDNVWKTMTKDVRKSLEDALDGVGADPDKKKKALEDFDKVSKEVKTVEDLSNILNKIFTEYGDTLSMNFMWFTFGGQKHLSVSCAPKQFAVCEAMVNSIKADGLDAGEVFAKLMADYLKARK